MSKTTMWIIAALGVVGIILMVSTKGSAGNSAGASVPFLPVSIPQFPQAPPMPAFQVQANPQYLYFNMPSDRNQTPPKALKKDGCGCEGNCEDLVSQVVVKPEVAKKLKSQLSKRFSLGPNPSNMFQQFPPALYPWLYDKGGSA